MKAFFWAIRSIRRRGLAQTSAIVVSNIADLSFDLYHGTETRAKVPLATLDLQFENAVHGVVYQPSKAAPVLKLLQRLDLPKNGTFVDFGSGKGRMLMLAAKTGFAKVVGVEFSTELCEVARRNITTFTRRTGITAQIDIVASDVAQYPINEDQNVFFMYNPFNDVVMKQVLSNLRNSVGRSPRQVWLIYNTPEHSDTILRAGLFRTSQHHRIGGNDFVVFAS